MILLAVLFASGDWEASEAKQDETRQRRRHFFISFFLVILQDGRRLFQPICCVSLFPRGFLVVEFCIIAYWDYVCLICLFRVLYHSTLRLRLSQLSLCLSVLDVPVHFSFSCQFFFCVLVLFHKIPRLDKIPRLGCHTSNSGASYAVLIVNMFCSRTVSLSRLIMSILFAESFLNKVLRSTEALGC